MPICVFACVRLFQAALAARKLPTKGSDFECLMRLEDAIEEEGRAAKARIAKARQQKQEITDTIKVAPPPAERAEVNR